jgi:hypothetical protein
LREFKLIINAINNFNLSLKGLSVLTEAASGNYKWGPIIAAQANAKVIAFARNSVYSSVRNIKSEINGLAKKLNLSNNIKIVTKLNSRLINNADIITNTCFLRPLDKNKLKYCKNTVVIPLMWETWEYRENDLDLSYCHKNGIPVLGTNESHPYLNTISYLGPVVKKLLLEKNIEIFKSHIGIVGKGKFANAITKSLLSEGSSCYNVTAFNKHDKNILAKCDALILADHESDTLYIGEKGEITGTEIKNINSDLLIIHISGKIDSHHLKTSGIKYYPEKIAPPHYMSVATDYAGPKPLIDLFTAGLKVAELLSKFRKKGLSYNKSISLALKNKICQDFSSKQKNKYFY